MPSHVLVLFLVCLTAAASPARADDVSPPGTVAAVTAGGGIGSVLLGQGIRYQAKKNTRSSARILMDGHLLRPSLDEVIDNLKPNDRIIVTHLEPIPTAAEYVNATSREAASRMAAMQRDSLRAEELFRKGASAGEIRKIRLRIESNAATIEQLMKDLVSVRKGGPIPRPLQTIMVDLADAELGYFADELADIPDSGGQILKIEATETAGHRAKASSLRTARNLSIIGMTAIFSAASWAAIEFLGDWIGSDGPRASERMIKPSLGGTPELPYATISVRPASATPAR